MSNVIKRKNVFESGQPGVATLTFLLYSLSVASAGPVAGFGSWSGLGFVLITLYRGADMSLARPGRKQATATEDIQFHISYL